MKAPRSDFEAQKALESTFEAFFERESDLARLTKGLALANKPVLDWIAPAQAGGQTSCERCKKKGGENENENANEEKKAKECFQVKTK